MKRIELKDSGLNKVKRYEYELKEDDLQDLPRGITPGEWVVFENKKNQKIFLGYINLHSTSFFKVKILMAVDDKDFLLKPDIEQVILESLLNKAFRKRSMFKELKDGYRLVYGAQDNLPGLLVDVFKNVVVIQINTAGIDRFREFIKDYCQKKFTDKKIILLDDEGYRKHEYLPQYPSEGLPEKIEVVENSFHYSISKNVFQKIGFYYDHRFNRKKMELTIQSLQQEFVVGVDLFSYVGSWGMHMLRAGVRFVDFVDQANMGETVVANLENNNLSGRGQFFRSDVFNFLDQKITENFKYDIVVSDPPAFTKSEKNKSNAVAGYEKLHQKCLKVLAEDGLFVVASCTHYLSLEDLDKTVQVAAQRESKKLQMLDIGMQSPDHPIASFLDKGNYIKYILYRRV